MNRHHMVEGLALPAGASVAVGLAALKDASRRARARWPREGARPSLTATSPTATGNSGRDGKTALQPNWKTGEGRGVGRTDHALQGADIFTRHRHPLWAD